MRPIAALVNFRATDPAWALSEKHVKHCFVLVALVLVGCGGKPKKPRPSPAPTSVPIAVDAGAATWTIRKSGKRVLVLKTESAEAAPSQKTGTLSARLSGQRATIFEEDKPTIELTGDVTTDDGAQTVQVQRGRLARTDGSATLRADAIRWDRKTHRITATGAVRLDMGGVALSGSTLTTDDAFTKLTLMP